MLVIGRCSLRYACVLSTQSRSPQWPGALTSNPLCQFSSKVWTSNLSKSDQFTTLSVKSTTQRRQPPNKPARYSSCCACLAALGVFAFPPLQCRSARSGPEQGEAIFLALKLQSPPDTYFAKGLPSPGSPTEIHVVLRRQRGGELDDKVGAGVKRG